jgi:hypothetical protein
VTAFHEQAVNGSSQPVAGESVPKVAPIIPQPVAVKRMAAAARTSTFAEIDRRKTRTNFSQGNTSDHATARTAQPLFSIMAYPPREDVSDSSGSGIIRPPMKGHNMPQLVTPDIDDGILNRLRERAVHHAQSVEVETKAILASALQSPVFADP